ncbi:MAG TPA: hypothetical protein VK623_02610 [Flavobacterium sp.]|nr:hypothetical protein [Flavobacterium sp.]
MKIYRCVRESIIGNLQPVFVEKLQGSIRVVSEEGKGTAFDIQLKNLWHDGE